MRLSTIQFSLFSACLLSVVPLSAQAQLTINTTQNSAVVGDNNQITQIVNQTIIYRPKKSNNSSNLNRSFGRGQNENNEKKKMILDDKDRGNHHHKHHGKGSHKGDRD
ncbi:MAG: hypothetical protein HC852_10715 [Acaryochloridaceae cyanobacterium RU_4_10]|nr:hypothetical protein [Acaryochloridaceae cyanobacterium RU_4_10]